MQEGEGEWEKEGKGEGEEDDTAGEEDGNLLSNSNINCQLLVITATWMYIPCWVQAVFFTSYMVWSIL